METPNVGDSPHHPSKFFIFPKSDNPGGHKRAAQLKWFNEFPWLHYSEESDKIFCFHCIKAFQQKKLVNSKLESTFISEGFSNWKKAIEKFGKHQSTDCHKEAILKLVTLPKQSKDVGELLSAQHALEKEENQKYLKKIVSNLRFLARQNIGLTNGTDPSESNFIQLVKLREEDDTLKGVWKV